MKNQHAALLWPVLFLIAAALSGCATSGQTYARQHPGLSAEQRKIFLSGKITNGTAVAGLTREEVRLVMGRDPSQFTKVNGDDAWVWVREGLPMVGPAEEQMGTELGGVGRDSGGGGTGRYGSEAAGSSAVHEVRPSRTTVYFHGGRATRAEVSAAGL